MDAQIEGRIIWIFSLVAVIIVAFFLARFAYRYAVAHTVNVSKSGAA